MEIMKCPKCRSYHIHKKSNSPTRLEPAILYPHWILFDAYDTDAGRFMGYNWLYQLAYHFKIPVVEIVSEFMPETMAQIHEEIEAAKKWSRKHRREGVVGKDYRNQIMFKEKIDLPARPRLKRRGQVHPEYPPMPEDKIISALRQAFDVVGEENWSNVKIAMPIVARYIATEAAEHRYDPPKSFYSWYINTSMERLRGIKNG